MLPWMHDNELYVLHPDPQQQDPHLDHVLVSMPLRLSPQTSLSILPNDPKSTTFGTDHPTLHLTLSLQSCSQPPLHTSEDSESVRPNLSRLREGAGRESLLSAYNDRAGLLEMALDTVEASVQGQRLSLAARQDAVDFADEACHRALMDSAFAALGSYPAKQVRGHRDLEATRLERDATISTTAGLRRWKKAQRGRTRMMVASAEGLEAGRTVEEDVLGFWGDVWGSNEEKGGVPEVVEEWDVEEVIDLCGGALESEFSEEAVQRAIGRYPKHKTGGEDGDHAVLLAALSPPIDDDASTAAAFALPRHLSRLLRLVAACEVVPERWGRCLVHLLPKRQDGDPTAATSRPIGMLPMFRRIFEAILVRRLSPEHEWASLHPGQAGFRRGWSCASALLYNHEAAHTRRNIAIFLDLANAFPSVTSNLVAWVLSDRGAPRSTQRLIWSLLTREASAALVVNGRRCAPLAFRRGLTQGAICSPALFNLIIDELVRLLNGRSGPANLRAVFFADDGGLLASSVPEAQELLNLAKAWADERGFRFNVGKCGVVARRPVSLYLGDAQIPQSDSYKYLGIPRTADGLDCVGWLTRVTTSMDNTLRLLQAVGGAWSGVVRLRLYQSVCRSLSDYGGGIAALTWSLVDTQGGDSLKVALRAAQAHHASAVKWICGSGKRHGAGEAMTSLLPPSRRYPLLSASLLHQLHTSSSCNPIHFLLHRPQLPSSALLQQVRTNSQYHDYLTAARHHSQVHPQAAALSVHAWIASQRRHYVLTQTGRLGAIVGAHQRGRGGADRVLSVPVPASRRLAVAWRCGVFGLGRRCLCAPAPPFTKFDRGHHDCLAYSIPLRNDDGPLSSSQLSIIADAGTDHALRQRSLSGVSDLQIYLIDFLLGSDNEEHHTIAMNALSDWDSALPTLPKPPRPPLPA
ncbi:hypothetical protein CF326_g2382 [Tilletia indica]|nr:hypothetical protein CF326_g2382 [Tilletia indica]